MCCLSTGAIRSTPSPPDLELQISAKVECRAGRQATTVAARKLQDLLRRAARRQRGQHRRRDNKMAVKAGSSASACRRCGGRLSAPDHRAEQLQTLQAAAEAAQGDAQAGRVRDGAAGHPLLSERHAVRARQGQLVCVATDGHRLSWATMPVEGNFNRQEIIVPRKTVIELPSCWAKR